MNTKLFKHQEEEMRNFQNRKALFWECGTGKTVGALAIFEKLRIAEPTLNMLVICPISLIEGAWGQDITKYTAYTYCNLREKPHKADIYIINYEAFLTKKIENFYNIFSTCKMVVLDESSRLKNFKSKTTKVLLSLRHNWKYRIVMSGTPAPNSEFEYWGQITFLDDTILPQSFFKFRNVYFHLERNGQRMQGRILDRAAARELFSKGWKYTITKNNREKLLAAISPISSVVKKDDCLDLPDEIDEIRSVELGKIQRYKYNEMKHNLITEIQGQIIPTTVMLAKIMKLREITSGFCISEQGFVEIEDAKKIEELKAVLEEIGDKQVIIWIEFHWEAQKILKELGEKAKGLYGETQDRIETIQEFQSNKFQYLIAHPKTSGYGLTFTNCSIQIFFSLSYSYEMYEQCKARIHRAGQKNNCVYIHLLAKNTIDEQIYQVLKKKNNLQKIIEEFYDRDRIERKSYQNAAERIPTGVVLQDS